MCHVSCSLSEYCKPLSKYLMDYLGCIFSGMQAILGSSLGVIEEGICDAFANISFSFEILHWFTVTWHVCSSWAGTVAPGAFLVLWVCSTAQCFASFYPSSRRSPSETSSTRCSSGRLMSHHSPKGQTLSWDRMQVFRPLHASCASPFFLLKT